MSTWPWDKRFLSFEPKLILRNISLQLWYINVYNYMCNNVYTVQTWTLNLEMCAQFFKVCIRIITVSNALLYRMHYEKHNITIPVNLDFVERVKSTTFQISFVLSSVDLMDLLKQMHSYHFGLLKMVFTLKTFMSTQNHSINQNINIYKMSKKLILRTYAYVHKNISMLLIVYDF